MAWGVYLLRCGDGTLYTGITDDLPRRLAAHRSGNPGPGAAGGGLLGSTAGPFRRVKTGVGHQAALSGGEGGSGRILGQGPSGVKAAADVPLPLLSIIL